MQANEQHIKWFLYAPAKLWLWEEKKPLGICVYYIAI